MFKNDTDLNKIANEHCMLKFFIVHSHYIIRVREFAN